jgi:hypothetical protein
MSSAIRTRDFQPVSASEGTRTAQATAKSPQQREPRSVYRVPCVVKVFDANGTISNTFCGQTLNISRAGLALRLAKALPVGSEVETLVPHSEQEPLCVRGEVVRVRPTLLGECEVGVRIQDLPPHD